MRVRYIVLKQGYSLTTPGVAGHITVRDPVEPSSFWVNPFGVAFSLIKSSDLIRVSHEGEVIEGGPCRLLNAAAFMIHSAIHAARPDVMCAAHSHSLHGRAFCTLGRPLDIISQDACAFHNVRPSISALCPADSLGSRRLQTIQRGRPRGRRRKEHRFRTRRKKGRAPPEPRSVDCRPVD